MAPRKSWYLWFFVFLKLLNSICGEISAPFSSTYPHDIGKSAAHLNNYFQYSKHDMAFTSIYLSRVDGVPSFQAYQSDKDPTYAIDMGSILYRTYESFRGFPGKGVMFHLDKNCFDEAEALAKLMSAVDWKENIYHIEAVKGPAGGDPVDFKAFDTDHLSKYNLTARVAVGFTKSGQSREGYTKAQFEELEKYMETYCKYLYSNYHIALDVYTVGQTAEDLSIDYYKSFMRCKLILYSLPNQKRIVNVRRVRNFIVDQVNNDRMDMIIPGRSITQRLNSITNVAWYYSPGHPRPRGGQLGQTGLLEIFDMESKMIRLDLYKLEQLDRFKNNPSFFFRKVTEPELLRLNIHLEHVPYLAQAMDWSQIVLLKPDEFAHMKPILDFFMPEENKFESSFLPFMEAQIFAGPNAPGNFDAAKVQGQFLDAIKLMDDTMVNRFKPVFSFAETHGQYTEDNCKQVLTFLSANAGLFDRIKYGLMLELGAANLNSPSFMSLVNSTSAKWIFVKDDMNMMNEAVLNVTAGWLPDLRPDKIVLLVMNDRLEKTNMMYDYFKKEDPVDRSGWYITTVTPTTESSTTTTKKKPKPVVPVRTEPPEPPINNNASGETVKSEGHRVHPANRHLVMPAMALVGITWMLWK